MQDNKNKNKKICRKKKIKNRNGFTKQIWQGPTTDFVAFLDDYDECILLSFPCCPTHLKIRRQGSQEAHLLVSYLKTLSLAMM